MESQHRDLYTIDAPHNTAIVFEVVGFQLTEEIARNSKIWAQATVLWLISRELLCKAGDVLARVISNVDGAPRNLDLVAQEMQIVKVASQRNDTGCLQTRAMCVRVEEIRRTVLQPRGVLYNAQVSIEQKTNVLVQVLAQEKGDTQTIVVRNVEDREVAFQCRTGDTEARKFGHTKWIGGCCFRPTPVLEICESHIQFRTVARQRTVDRCSVFL